LIELWIQDGNSAGNAIIADIAVNGRVSTHRKRLE
jgi:hypothetical protein